MNSDIYKFESAIEDAAIDILADAGIVAYGSESVTELLDSCVVVQVSGGQASGEEGLARIGNEVEYGSFSGQLMLRIFKNREDTGSIIDTTARVRFALRRSNIRNTNWGMTHLVLTDIRPDGGDISLSESENQLIHYLSYSLKWWIKKASIEA